MNRSLISQHLAQAEEHIAQGEEHLRHQRALVAQLQLDGQDVALARKILATFEKTQAQHIADRDWLLRELSKAPA